MGFSDKKIKVLLIEDNHTDYLLTSKILSAVKSPYEIELDWCKNYDSGLEELAKHNHDIYLIDYSLGVKNGLDLIQECHDKSISSGPFIMLTDFDATELFERSLELNVYDHILKSELSPSVLDRTLVYAIRRFTTEQALKSEQEFNAFILAEIPYLIISVDQFGLVSSVNPAAVTLLGDNEKALLQKSWKDFIHPEDREEIKYIVNDNGEVSFETRVFSKDKEERVINWNILNKGVSRDSIDTTAFILSGKDITDQIKAEETERRRQKMEALGQLAGGVAHEINNLLQPILMSSQMVASKVEGGVNSDDSEYFLKNMERIERNTKSAAKIVDDILLFSRGDHKDTEQINMRNAIEEAVIFVKDMLPSTILTESSLEELDAATKSDINKNELIQIITNMLINASHAMSENGTVIVAAKNSHLKSKDAKLMKLEEGDYVIIDITDTGYGISEANQINIFNPFFTTKEVGEGTGLGLSIVYKIIEKWGGAIKVQSKIDEGTTFSIYIPSI